MRLFLAWAVFSMAAASVASAEGHTPCIERRVHDPGVCWEADVEFPVPCEDDDD